ncbi:MAG: dethiobiotin synthase [Synergistaceae bacterium]|nr:dethiobiotin synthase [Synergistaceae bacterium]
MSGKRGGIFVTGTGTDVGKTYVAALIVKKLRERGFDAGYYKPALSGAEVLPKSGELLAGDAAHVCAVSGLDRESNSLVSYIYKTPVSPHFASRLEGKPIRLEKLKEDFATARDKFSFLTVEGCGGIVCPLCMDETEENGQGRLLLEDVIAAFGLGVLIVADSGLGTINAVTLTAEYARQKGITVKGIIFNRYEPDNLMHSDNINAVELLTGIKVIARVPAGVDDLGFDADRLAELYAYGNE